MLQCLEEVNAQQTAMLMTMVDRVEKLEQILHTVEQERERQRRSSWGIFSLQTR